jgi:hypothetical protein
VSSIVVTVGTIRYGARMASVESVSATMATTSALGAAVGNFIVPGAGAVIGGEIGAYVGAVVSAIDMIGDIFGSDDPEWTVHRDACGTVRRPPGWKDGKVGIEVYDGAGWIWMMRRLLEDGCSKSETLAAVSRWFAKHDRFEKLAGPTMEKSRAFANRERRRRDYNPPKTVGRYKAEYPLFGLLRDSRREGLSKPDQWREVLRVSTTPINRGVVEDAIDAWECRQRNIIIRFAEYTTDEPRKFNLDGKMKMSAGGGKKQGGRPPPVAAPRGRTAPTLFGAALGAGLAFVAAPTIPVVLAAAVVAGGAGYVLGGRKG